MKSKRKSTKPAPASEVRIGAARALERLEAEEAGLYSAYKNARASGDALTAKVARDGWLKVSESLRKYDLMIASARRGEGELVPRKQVEGWLHNAANWLHFSLIPVCENDRDKAFDSAARTFEGFVASKDHNAPVPLWMAKALFSHCAWKDRDEVLLRWRRCYHVQDAMERFGADLKKICEHVEASMKADEAELKEASL